MRLLEPVLIAALLSGSAVAQTPPAQTPADQPALRPAPGFGRPARPGLPQPPLTRPSPGFERPVRPDLPRPTPVPERPGYGRPVDPGFSRPGYGRPGDPSYGRPGYGRPGDPDYGRPGYGGSRGYAGRITCESDGSRERRCFARADNRVTLARQISSTRCVEGGNFRATRDAILVRGGCRGEFYYGYGSFAGGGWNGGYPYPEPERRSNNTGAVIAGVAVAGGLLAALAASQGGQKRDDRGAPSAPPPGDRYDDRGPPPPQSAPALPSTYKPGPPATISADFAALPADARPVAQACMFEAARQVGATGGTRLTWDRLRELQPGNGGYRIRADLKATYPDGERELPVYCRATPSKVVQLDFG